MGEWTGPSIERQDFGAGVVDGLDGASVRGAPHGIEVKLAQLQLRPYEISVRRQLGVHRNLAAASPNGEKYELADPPICLRQPSTPGGFCANNPILYALADATHALSNARANVLVE
ncbi:MAG: hypothetical protein QOJ15_7979 [Bradyrhizobium sp.]|jgi:hypothetical protein|nr:hypothetical protein [Bradyrhizobium sp.]